MTEKPRPQHLQDEGCAFWQAILSDYDLDEGHHLKLLELACESLDRIAQARRHLRKHGCFFLDRFKQLKENPSGKVERDNKVLFARLMRELGLDLEPPKENRSPQL